MATESIIKDSFYKERLLQTSFQAPSENIESDSHKYPCESYRPISEEVLKKSLENFGKCAAGHNYAYLGFRCNYQDIESLSSLANFTYLEHIDASNNKVSSLKPLAHLRYLVTLILSHNKLRRLDFNLDTIDCSFNEILQISSLAQHKYLRSLSLRNNKIVKIQGLAANKTLRILDLSENQIEDVEGLDNLNLTELYLSSNKIQTVKGLSKLEQLRVLDLSCNEISLLGGLAQLISLRTLLLSKNRIKHVRQLSYLENLAYLSEIDLCYNPIQERRYYRMQVLNKLPMLRSLDGTEVTPEEVVKAENLYGQDVEERSRIFKSLLPQEEFIDRRIHTFELIEVESDSGGQQVNFIDKYDEHGALRQEMYGSRGSRGSKGSRGSRDKSHSASKRSFQSKMSKASAIG